MSFPKWVVQQLGDVADISKSWIVKKCKKIFYHLFNSVKYLYLHSDTFRKHVERHVTYRKLAFKFTGYCRQSSYTDSAVVFTLLPAVAWDLKSQFPGGYMHFNICFKGVSGKIGIFHNEKLPIEFFWFFCLSRSWQWAGASLHCLNMSWGLYSLLYYIAFLQVLITRPSPEQEHTPDWFNLICPTAEAGI